MPAIPPPQPLRALMRTGFALAIGAIMLGIFGLLLTWLAPDALTARIPLVLVIPGIALICGAALFTVKALGSEGKQWKAAYSSAARGGYVIASLGALATVGMAIWAADSAHILQLLLVAIIALQGPLALLLVARRLVYIVEHPNSTR